MKSKYMRIPIFVPHIGCPYDCVFCNQRHITGIGQSLFDESAIRLLIERYFVEGDKRDVEIAFFGGSFTGIEKSLQLKYLDIAQSYVNLGLVDGIRFSTRPDYISEDILERLKGYKIRAIELGVQSTDEEVLQLSHRGHSFECVGTSSALIKSYGIELGLQMMLGLPGDTFVKSMKTLEDIIELKPNTLRIYPTLVFEHTDLALLYKKGEYVPLLLSEAVEWSKKMIERLESTEIKLIRLGLHNTENLADSEHLLAGPYHPAFGQLVYDGLLVDKIIRRHLEESIEEIICNQVMYQRLIGYQRQGLERLQQVGICTIRLQKHKEWEKLDDTEICIIYRHTGYRHICRP